MNAQGVAESETAEPLFDLESLFRRNYARVGRVIARVVGNPARAEEIAVEVFLRLWRTRRAQGESAEGWLYRAAVRAGLDEIRRQNRRTRYERLVEIVRGVATPEEIFAATQEQQRVRLVLSVIGRRHAEFLILRSHGFSYDEVAAALDLNPASIGTLLSRARQEFRKEYLKRYGGPNG